MQRYFEAFFAHKLLLILPIILSLVVSVALVASQPRTWEASGGMWFQSNTIAGDVNRSTQDPTPTPAAAATNVFKELLGARTFCLKVANRGPLAGYVSDPRHDTHDPVSQATGVLSGLQGNRPRRPSQQILNDTMVYTLQHNVTVTTSGPHIVTLTMKFADGTVAAGTLQAIFDQFSDEVLATIRAQQDLTKTQLADRQKAMQDAEAAVSRYTASHPELRLIGAPADAVLEQLQQTANQNRQRYAEAQTQYDQMRLQGDSSNFRIIDRPSPPNKPVSVLNSLIFAGVGGVGVGLILSFVALVLLVLGDRTLNDERELEQMLQVKAVGSVPLVRKREWRRPPAERASGPGTAG